MGQPPAPPMGSSPATQPTQNRGMEVAAIKMAGMALKFLEQIIPMAGSQSELGSAAMDAMRKLSKFVPAGAVTPQDVERMVQQFMIKQRQFGANMQAMQAGQARQAAAPAQGAPPAQAA